MNLETIANSPIVLDGIEFRQLTPREKADACQWLRSRRMQAVLEQTRHVPVSDAAVGAAMGACAAVNITRWDLLSNEELASYLLWKSMRKADGSSLSEDAAYEKLESLGNVVCDHLLIHALKLERQKGEDGEVPPLGMTAGTKSSSATKMT